MRHDFFSDGDIEAMESIGNNYADSECLTDDWVDDLSNLTPR